MDITIDNQQVKPQDLAWLAGFIDADGSITVFKTQRRSGKYRYNPSIVITNSDELVMAHIIKLLDSCGIRMHLFHKEHKNSKNWKDMYQLTTRNMNYIEKLLTLLLPYLVLKKPRAELTLRFVKSRLKQKNSVGSWTQGTEYTEEEINMAEQLKLLNRKGKPSETIRQNA